MVVPTSAWRSLEGGERGRDDDVAIANARRFFDAADQRVVSPPRSHAFSVADQEGPVGPVSFSLFEHRQTGELAPLEKLERGAAARRDVSDGGAPPGTAASAAIESPPPTTVSALLSAMASAIAMVPALKASTSKMPIGPFQNNVRAAVISAR